MKGCKMNPNASQKALNEFRAKQKAQQEQIEEVEVSLEEEFENIDDDRESTWGQLTAECNSLKEQLLRATAEIDNTRKRLERDRDEKVKFALSSLMKELLPVVDAFQALEEYDAGVEATWKLFIKALEKHGLKIIENPIGKQADPNFHEVISMEQNTEYESGKVSKILREGYILNGRLIRPAMVMVAE